MLYRNAPGGATCKTLNINIFPHCVDSKWQPMTTAARKDDKSLLIYLPQLPNEDPQAPTNAQILTQTAHKYNVRAPFIVLAVTIRGQ